jgi:stage II sporulation protein D
LRQSLILCLCTLALLLPWGCSEQTPSASIPANNPRIRVLLLDDATAADIGSDATAQISLDASPTPRLLRLGPAAMLTLSGNIWRIGSTPLGSGILTIQSPDGVLLLNRSAYRGFFRFIPAGPGTFDVVNDLDIEDYIQGVVACEMYHDWQLEAYKAQAVASRTYALYEARSTGMGRAWDVFADQRSQVYGAIAGETDQSRFAAQATSGIVLTYGPGDGKIFKAYFSSCCGGVSQAAADAFPGEPYLPPLSEQYRGACCSASKYFNWGPITVSKSELTRRFRLWGQHLAAGIGKPVPEATMANIYRMDVQSANRYGRPTRVLVTDTRGIQYSLAAEDMRAATNTDAQTGSTLPSSFCKINGDPNLDSVTFFDGHGFGHGVGMCQWCAEARAQAGESTEQILLASYPGAKLIRAY